MHALSKVFLVAVPKIKELKKAIKAMQEFTSDLKKNLQKSSRKNATLSKKSELIKVIPLLINICEPLQQIAEAFSENRMNHTLHSRIDQSDSDSSDNDSSESDSNHPESVGKALLSSFFEEYYEEDLINLKRVVKPEWQDTIQELGSAILFDEDRNIRDEVAAEVYSMLDNMKTMFDQMGYDEMLSALQWDEQQIRRYCFLLRLDTDQALRIVYAKKQQKLAEKMPAEITELKQEITGLKTTVEQMADVIRTMQAQQQAFLAAVIAEKVGENTKGSQPPSLFKRQ